METKNKQITIKIPLILLMCVLVFSLGVSAVSAASTSDNSTIYVSTQGNDTWDGLSATHNGTSGPKATIANAVGTVATNGTVHIAQGTYNESGIDINQNMTITGENQDNTIINGQQSGISIFYIETGITLTINNLTLTNSTAFYGGAICNEGNLTVINSTFTGNNATSYGFGAAIYNVEGNLTVINSTFTNNTACNGGAIYNVDGSLTVTNSTFTGNNANSGGAILNDGTSTVINDTFTGNNAAGGTIYNEGSLTLINSTFTGNTAGLGGAICNEGSLTVINSTFTGNNATYGGAICNSGNLTVNNISFIGNNASYGGAIYTEMCSDGTDVRVTITNNIFKDNSADYGGAIYFYSYTYDGTGDVIITLNNSTFTSNSADYGGAIFNYIWSDYGNMTVTINNSTFTSNSANYDGGAIYNQEGLLILNNSSFTGNSASYEGGAIFNYGDTWITGCGFTGNNASYGGAIFNYYGAGTLTVNFSRIVGNIASCGAAIYYGLEPDDVMAFDQEVGQLLDVRYNWWGSNIDPKLVDNLIAGEVEGVNADPWLILSVNASPSEILNTQTSCVTVDLFTDSSNGSHSGEFSKYPAVIPVSLTTMWGSVTGAVLNYGTGVATFTANGGPIPTPNVAIVSAADSANLTAMVNTAITIKPAANLYVKITSTNNNPKVGETFMLTYKLGNKGPDAASNVTITIPVPENFEITSITGDGNWTYNTSTRTITWTLTNVPMGDPYLYITGTTTKPGSYSFGSSITSETYNLNTEGVTPITINAANNTNTNSTTDNTASVNAASNTVPMQTTGMPIAGLILAILAVLGGTLAPRKK